VIRGLARVAVVGLGAAWVVDRWLARRAPDGEIEPIEALIVIDAPIERVWDILVDLPRQPTWMLDLKDVKVLTPPPVGRGTRATGTVRILGIAVDDPVEIVGFEPPRLFAIRHDGMVAGEGRIELEPGADGTTTIVHWTELLLAPFLPHLGSAVGSPVLGAVFQADLRRLKRLVETGSADA
jgi:uncharacterized membrane protein